MLYKFNQGLVALALGIFVIGVSANAATPKRYKAEIHKYTDGDSFKLKLDTGEIVEVRMVGADTPEAFAKKGSNQERHASKASKYFRKLVPEKTELELELQGLDLATSKDRFKRTLGWVFVKGTEVGLDLVKNGYAAPYMYCSKDVCKNNGYADFVKRAKVKEHLEGCKQARKDGLNMWDPKDEIEQIPQEFRRDDREQQAKRKSKKTELHTDKIVADFYTKEYLPKGQRDYTEKTLGINYCDRVMFDDESHAEDAGFKAKK